MSTVQTMFKITAAVSGTNSVRELNREIGNVSTSSEKMKRVMVSAAGELRGAFSSLAAGYAGMKILRTADEMSQLRASVKLASETAREADEAWAGLKKTAFQTGSGLGSLVTMFERLSGVRKEIGFTNKEVLRLVESTGLLAAASRGNKASKDAGLTQLAQMFALPTAQAEEWNSVIEQIFGVGSQIAKEFGVSVGHMKALTKEGQILTKDVAVALYNALDDAQEKFKELEGSPARAAARFSVAFGIVAEELDKTTGTTGAWAGLIDLATNALLGMGKVLESVINTAQASFRTVFGGLYSLFNKFMSFLAQSQYAMVATVNRLPFQNLDREEAGAKASWMARDEYSRKYESELIANIKADLAAASAAGKAATQAFRGQGSLFETSQAAGDKKLSNDYAGLAAALAGGSDAKGDKAAAKEAATAAREETSQLKEELEAAAKAREQLFGVQASKELFAYADDAKNVGKSLGDAMTSAFRGAEDALIQFTKTGKLSVRDLANSVIEDLMRIQIRQNITGPLSSMLGSLFGGAQGSFAQASLRGAANPALYGPGFATGGSFKVGGSGGTDSQRVAFRASPGERVTISRGDQGGGFGNVSVTVNVQGGGDVEADSEKGKKLGQMMAAIAKSTIVNEKRPGGVLA